MRPRSPGCTFSPKGWKVSTVGDVTTCLGPEFLDDRSRIPDRVDQGHVPYYGANGQQGWMNKALFDEPLVLVAEDGGRLRRPGEGRSVIAYDGLRAWVNGNRRD